MALKGSAERKETEADLMDLSQIKSDDVSLSVTKTPSDKSLSAAGSRVPSS